MNLETLGPPCAYGSRAALPADPLAASVIRVADCADYLECIGWLRGAARREHLRAAAESYCRDCDVMGRFPHEVACINAVESYMRHHVAARIAQMRAQRKES